MKEEEIENFQNLDNIEIALKCKVDMGKFFKYSEAETRNKFQVREHNIGIGERVLV